MPMPIRRWLSQGAEVMESELLAQGEEDFDCDVLIIGSGYGGAVAAARLSGLREADGQPSRVWVMERGQEHPPGSFPSHWAELAGEVRLSMQDGQPARGRAEGLYDLRLGPDAAFLLGNGVGGGSLINAGVMLEPDPAVFEQHWPQALRTAAGDGSLGKAFETAREVLSPEPVPSHRTTPKYRVLQRLHDPAGAAQDLRVPITVNTGQTPRESQAGVLMPACTRCGDCLTGCNVGAKGSLDTNYLALGVQLGARIFTGGTAVHVERWADPGRSTTGWAVHWQYTDAALRRRQTRHQVRARRVVLAAGAAGSTEILWRSRTKGLPLSPTLGQRAWLNGDTLFAGVGYRAAVHACADPQTDPHNDSARQVGPTITGSATVALNGGRRARVQDFAVPAALRQVFGEITTTRFAFGLDRADRLSAQDPLAVSPRALERTALFGAMVEEPEASAWSCPRPGSEDWEGLRLDMPRNAAGQVTPWPALRALRVALDASTREDAAALLWADRAFDGALPRITVHPLGGCAMADDASLGVVDDRGRVYSRDQGTDVHPGLIVLDGSIVPRALGVNPALTITALAERALELLLADTVRTWGRGPRADPVTLAARATDRRDELGADLAHWSLRERLQGPCTLDGKNWWARLDLSFELLPGWRRILPMEERAMTVLDGRLTLHGPLPQAASAFDFDGDEGLPPPAAEAAVSGSVALSLVGQGRDGAATAGPELTLEYRLALTGASTDARLSLPSLRAGARLHGRKVLPLSPVSTSGAQGLLRRLSTLPEVRLDDQVLGTWSLDLSELAQRQGALAELARASNLPDAIADLLALAAYGVRATFDHGWVATLTASRVVASEEAVAAATQRLPLIYAAGGPTAEVHPPTPGERPWRLTRWKAQGRPVLLIHGLGVGGSMFCLPDLGRNLAAFLHDPQGAAGGSGTGARDVWVLDLSSSTALVARRGTALAEETVQQIGRRDIPDAIDWVGRATQQPVDVVAHCMGGVQFLLAVLGDDAPDTPAGWRKHIRCAVISQTGPVLRLGAANRLRAAVLGPLRPWWPARWLHAVPQIDLQPDPEAPQETDVELDWHERLFGAAASQFPHSDDEAFEQRLEQHKVEAWRVVELREIRARADLIFGQLFEADAVAPSGLAALPALFGAVPLKLLAEALNFVRHDMITEHDGGNAVLSAERVRKRLTFPVQFLHGRRNRVFHWRGALRGAQWLAALSGLRRDEADAPGADGDSSRWRWGAGRIELVVWNQHGHLDTMIGERSHIDVFPALRDFIDRDPQPPAPRPVPGRHAVEAPWLGPMLGAVQRRPGRFPLRVHAVLHPTMRRTGCEGIAVMPLHASGAGLQPDLDRGRWLPWPGAQSVRWPAAADARDTRAAALVLDLDPSLLGDAGHRLALVSLHRDEMPRAQRTAPMPADGLPWLAGGRPLVGTVREGVAARLAQGLDTLGHAELLPLTLSPQVLDAADLGHAVAGARLRLALASCQYPPLLLDTVHAQAAMQRLFEQARDVQGPQLLLLAGDQVYVDADAGVLEVGGGQADDPSQRRAVLDEVYRRTWTLPAWRAVLARLPAWPMLDDHEVRDDWQGAADAPGADVDAALSAYDHYQGLLAWGRPLVDGSRSRVAWPGGVPVCVLDTRSRRERRSTGRLAQARMLPEEEMQALLDWLTAQPEAAVKLVLSPVPLLPPERAAGVALADGDAAHALRADTWAGFPASAAALLRGIRERRLRRVVLLAGDSHLSSVSTLELPGHPDPIVGVVASGLYAPWPFANQRPSELAPDGRVAFGPAGQRIVGELRTQAVMRDSGFALVDVEPGADGAATVSVRLCAGDGGTLSTRVRFARIAGA